MTTPQPTSVDLDDALTALRAKRTNPADAVHTITRPDGYWLKLKTTDGRKEYFGPFSTIDDAYEVDRRSEPAVVRWEEYNAAEEARRGAMSPAERNMEDIEDMLDLAERMKSTDRDRAARVRDAAAERMRGLDDAE